jgi:hypothetical protein
MPLAKKASVASQGCNTRNHVGGEAWRLSQPPMLERLMMIIVMETTAADLGSIFLTCNAFPMLPSHFCSCIH